MSEAEEGYVGAELAPSAVAQLPEEMRLIVWRHAVDLYAFYGKPVEQLSREQIAMWLGLRAEFERLPDVAPARPANAMERDVLSAIEEAKRAGFYVFSWSENTERSSDKSSYMTIQIGLTRPKRSA